jgi:hypothetical protein
MRRGSRWKADRNLGFTEHYFERIYSDTISTIHKYTKRREVRNKTE